MAKARFVLKYRLRFDAIAASYARGPKSWDRPRVLEAAR
jgi:hypothetical protein